MSYTDKNIRPIVEQGQCADTTTAHADVYFDGDVTHEIRGTTYLLRVVDVKGLCMAL